MRRIGILFILLALAFNCACNRDPRVVAQKYVENGNRYFDRGKYKEAAIMYRNALKKSPKFVEAHYRLGLTALRMGRLWPDAVRSFQRASDETQRLTPAEAKLVVQAQEQLGESYLFLTRQSPKAAPQLLGEIDGLADKLAKKDPNSIEAMRLKAQVYFMRDNDRKKALAEYSKANQIKPGEPQVVLPLAEQLVLDGRGPDGEKLLKELIAKKPTVGGAYDLLFGYYAHEKQDGPAEAILKQKTSAIPNSPEPWLRLAAYYFRNNRRADMDQSLAKISSNAKTFPNGRMLAGEFYVRIRDFDRAIQEFKAGLDSDSAHKSAYQILLANTYLAQNNKAEAARILEDVRKNDPKNVQAQILHAGLLIDSQKLEDVRKAVDNLQKAVSQVPNDASLRFNLGRALMATRRDADMEMARTQFREAKRLSPYYTLARLALCRLSLMRRDWNGAITEAQDILQYDPDNLQARVIRSDALIQMGNLDQARTEVGNVMRLAPNSRDGLLRLARLDLMQNRPQEAEQIFKGMMQPGSSDLTPLMGLSETYAQQGRYDQGIKVLQAELDRNPQPVLRIGIANLSLRAHQYDAAAAQYRSLLDKDPNAVDLWVRLGETQRLKGDINGAMQSFRKAIQLNPNSTLAYLPLALVLDGLGQRSEAKTMYQKALQLQPDNPMALNNLAFLMAETGDNLDQALTLAQRARQKMPQNEDVADTLGLIYIRKNLSDNAIDIYREVLERKPENPIYRYHMAMALYGKGDLARARQEAQAALQKKPPKTEEPKIRELLAKIG